MKVGLHSNYLESCFNVSRTKEIIKTVKKNLKGIEFDGFLVQGLSGIIMGTLVARALGKKIVVARKGEKTHGMLVENIMDGDKLIILDDFCSSGDTIKKIFKTLKSFKAWFYSDSGSSTYRNPNVNILGSVFYSRGCVFVPGSTAKIIVKNVYNIIERWDSKLECWTYKYSR